MERCLIKLYVTGRTPRSRAAIANLREICETEPGWRFELVVIDVLERPRLAEDEKILATPTVIKELPPPIRRVVGDLSDTERVLLGLDLRSIGGDVEARQEVRPGAGDDPMGQPRRRIGSASIPAPGPVPIPSRKGAGR